MAETTGTTRPARQRAATTRTSAAKTTTKPAAKPAEAAPAKTPAKTEVTRFKVELEHDGATKSYEKFVMPDSYKGTAVGSIYAPLGTARVAVLIIGADDTDE